MSDQEKNYSYYYNRIYDKMRRGDFPLLREFVKKCKQGPILEIGAGTGRVVEANLDRELHFLDKDEKMLIHLKHKVKGNNQYSVILGDSSDMPMKSETYSGCFITMATIHEIKPIIFTLNEIKRVLKNDGLLYLLIANPMVDRPGTQGLVKSVDEEIEYSLSNTVDPTHSPFGHEVEFRISSLDDKQSFFLKQSRPPMEVWYQLFKEAGFEICSSESEFTSEPFDEGISSFCMMTLRKNQISETKELSTLAGLYDKMAPNYQEIIKTHNYMGEVWIRNFVKKYLPTHLTVLDLGCGDGLVGKVFKSCGKYATLYGLDFSKEMIELTQQSGNYKSVCYADLSNGLPIIDSRLFDVVTAFGVLEFTKNHLEILMRVRDSLHIGGEFWGTLEKGSASFYDKKTNVTKYRYETIEEVRTLLTDIDFDILEIRELKAFDSPNFDEPVIYYVFRVKKTQV